MTPKARAGVALRPAGGPATATVEQMALVVADACSGFLDAEDPQAVLEHLARMLDRVVTYDALAIMEPDWARLELRPRVVAGALRHPGTSAPRPIGDSPAGRAFLQAEPSRGPKSLFVPLTVGTHRLGVLELRREDGGRFNTRDLERCTTLAGLAATAWRRSEERGRLEEARKAAEEQLHRLTREDLLTGLPNRQLLHARLAQSLHRAGQTGAKLVVVVLDIDHFKRINESLGRAAGDQLLLQLARRLAMEFGAGDTVARLAGDEFVIVHEPVSPDLPDGVGARIEALLADPFVLDGEETFVTGSCGAVVASGDSPVEDLLRDAETAMYAAKARGGAGVAWFEESMRRRARGRVSLEATLRRAVERRELEVAFQPIVRLGDDVLVGLEALARWPRPGLPQVGPAEFIPMAEAMGIIDQLGECVLDAALEQLARWRDDIPAWRSLFVAVNLSPRQLVASDLLVRCLAALDRHGLPPDALRLEVTEEALVEGAERSGAILREICDNGIAIAMDDFGTGFSSLSRLKQLPVTTLKVDRSFVDGLGSDPSDSSIVRAIVGLGHALSLELCAEGVELPLQRDHLAALGCHQGQGFLWAPPLPAGELTAALAPHAGRVPAGSSTPS